MSKYTNYANMINSANMCNSCEMCEEHMPKSRSKDKHVKNSV